MTYEDFVSIYSQFARPCKLMRLAPGWGDVPYVICNGLVLLTGKERERVDSGVETSRTTTTAFFATKESKVYPCIGDLIETMDSLCYRIEEVNSIDIFYQVFELKVMQFKRIDK